jgi:hypothetical protein
MSNLISKYNISEKDLYSLGVVEFKKNAGGYLEKEKLKAVSLKILKPYKVKFMDLANLLREIKDGDFYTKYSESITHEEKLEIEKMIQENSNVSKFYKEWWSEKSKKQKWLIVIAVLFIFGIIGQNTNHKKNKIDSITTIEDTKTCLVGCDWLYPSSKNPLGAWKFSSDGTFNSSSTTFGGMSAWGNWSIIGPGQIRVTYTRTTEGVIPQDQTLQMSSCNSLTVGSTNYSKY